VPPRRDAYDGPRRTSEEDIRGEHFLTDPETHRKIVDALYRAAASGGWVDLGDTPR